MKYTDRSGTEHFWLEVLSHDATGFEGRIGNDAEIVHVVKYGDPVHVRDDEVEDWMYVRNGRLYGGFTLRVLAAMEPNGPEARYAALLEPPDAR